MTDVDIPTAVSPSPPLPLPSSSLNSPPSPSPPLPSPPQELQESLHQLEDQLRRDRERQQSIDQELEKRESESSHHQSCFAYLLLHLFLAHR